MDGSHSGSDYEWYVTLNDGKATTTGPTWSFKATAGGNTAPFAANDAYAVNEDVTLNVAAPGVLTNDTDADGNSLSAVIVTGPSHGAVALSANGSFSYTPIANFNGSDSFTYKANDGTADSNVATVSITVTAVNDAPVASAQSVTTNEDTAKAITLSATDVEGSTLTCHDRHRADARHVERRRPTVTYTPAANYNGPDSFTFKANDGALDSNVATVSITVTAVNDAPIASDQSVTTNEDTAKAITLSATDVEGSTLTYTIGTGPDARHAERRRADGHLHAGGQLQRARQLHVQSQRRHARFERRDGVDHGHGGERRAGGE